MTEKHPLEDLLEPGAVKEAQRNRDMNAKNTVDLSVAISLKRIADVLATSTGGGGLDHVLYSAGQAFKAGMNSG